MLNFMGKYCSGILALVYLILASSTVGGFIIHPGMSKFDKLTGFIVIVFTAIMAWWFGLQQVKQNRLRKEGKLK